MTDHRETAGSARDRLRAVHERQLATLTGYLAAAAKLDRARAALQTVETDQTLTLGELDFAGAALRRDALQASLRRSSA